MSEGRNDMPDDLGPDGLHHPEPVPQDQRGKGFFYRKSTIRMLWTVGILFLAGLVASDLTFKHYNHFGLDASFNFYSWYGFVSCAAMVIGAKALGFILKRKDTYYTRPGDLGIDPAEAAAETAQTAGQDGGARHG